MIGYATIGTKDLPKAEAFYNELLGTIGGKQVMGLDRIKFYGTDDGGAMLAVCTPANEGEQSCGNGQMVAIPGFYGGYVFDLDGNKLCFFHMTPA